MYDGQEVLVIASGTKDRKKKGGSGFENLVQWSRSPYLEPRNAFRVVGVASEFEDGSIRERADRLEIPFFHLPQPWTAERYQALVEQSGASWVTLSGWLHMARGLDPRTTFGIHPGDPRRFGGSGMHGIHVHRAALEACERGEVAESAVTMSFIVDNEQYDTGGPIAFYCPVPIRSDDTAETLASRVNYWEHYWQPIITGWIVNGHISWDGVNPDSLRVPKHYHHLPLALPHQK